MSLSSLRYVIKETALSLRRNAWMSLASVSTVAISLIILGFALTLVYNTNQLASNIESNIEISAFILRPPQTTEQVQQIQAQIEQMQGVKSVTLLSKEQALAQFQSGLNSDLMQNLGGNNPLPDKLTVKATDAGQVKDLAEKIGKISGVDTVRYGQGIVDKIIQFTHWMRWIGLTLIGLLAVASIVLISITIRLTVFARRKEVQIMKFVGATDWFIRWPFLLEGMVLGLCGAILASTVVVYSYTGLVSYLHNNLTFIPVIDSRQFMLNLTLLMLAAGALIGSVGSMVSLRKFLKV